MIFKNNAFEQFHHSIIPTLQRSTIPLLPRSKTPLFQHSNIPLFRYSITLIFQHSIIPAQKSYHKSPPAPLGIPPAGANRYAHHQG